MTARLLVVHQPAWLPGTFRLYAAAQLPNQAAPVTAVFIFARHAGPLAVVDVDARGWDLPGGHVDSGEHVADAAVRELAEETGLACTADDLHVVGYAHLDAPGQFDTTGGRYPDHSTMLYVAYDAPAGAALTSSLEVRAACWVPDTNVRDAVGARSWLPLWEHLIR